MTLANRLLPDNEDRDMMIVQKEGLNVPARLFCEDLGLLCDVLFKPGQSQAGLLLLTSTGFELGQNIHFMAIGSTPDHLRDGP